MTEQSEITFDRAKKRRESRPWGTYEILTSGPGFQLKRLTVKTESRLSLQWHRHRDETWVVARGSAKVTVGKKEHTMGRGQSTFVARNIHHRIENICCGSNTSVFTRRSLDNNARLYREFEGILKKGPRPA